MAQRPQDSRRSDWNDYNNRCNPRDSRLSRLWVQDLRAWLLSSRSVGAGSVVLDYGCGSFDLGFELAEQVSRVDGYDINPQAIRLARGRAARRSGVFGLYADADQIPDRTYDVIVANSVIQYLASLEAVAEFLHSAKVKLKPVRGAMIVLCDLIPCRYPAALDALESAVYALRKAAIGPMFLHLWRTATRPSRFELLHIDRTTIQDAARDAGCECELLDENLTPSKRRYSCVLRPRSS